MSENKSGFVYILTNPSFREDWVKISYKGKVLNDIRMEWETEKEN